MAVSDLEVVTLISEGDITGARLLFEITGPEEIDWLFFEGRVKKAQGQLIEATEVFREVLLRDPTYLDARRELAHSLFLNQDYRGATYHFRDLLRDDPSAEQRQGYLHFLNEIDRIRPFSLSGSIAFVTSSNVNRGSSEDTFNPGVPDFPAFDITSQAEPGVGLEFGVAGRHVWRRAKGYSWALNWSVAGRTFEVPAHNSATIGTRLQFGHATENTWWAIGTSIRTTWYASDDHRVETGLDVSMDRRIAPQVSLVLSANADYRDDLSSDALDGPLYAFQVGVVRLIANGQIAAGVRATLNRPRQAHSRFNGQTVFTSAGYAWPGGFEAGVRLDVGRRGYLADFPLAGEAREDSFYQVTVSTQHEGIRFGRFSPSLSCSIGTTHSNVAFYDYDVRECSVGLVTRF